MARCVCCCIGLLCIGIVTVLGADRPQEAARSVPIRQVRQPLPTPTLIGPAADPADVASEQQARARLAALKQRVAASQREIRELEALLDESTQILVEIQMVEVDAAEARKVGLPAPPEDGGGTVEPIPTAAQADHQSWREFPAPVASEIIKKLVQQEVAKIVAAPRLLTESGRGASLRVGGEFPVFVPQAKDAVGVEWMDCGTKTNVTPTILDSGRVKVSLDAWVGERDHSNGTNLKGTVVPGLSVRHVAATVEMDFGNTHVMLCGINTGKSRENSEAQAPILNKVPYVSRLFTNVSHEDAPQRETALFVLVTPRLVPRSHD